jgi:hypothetical protein
MADCFPGETCFFSECTAPRTIDLTVWGCTDCSAVRVWIVATPRDVSYPEFSSTGASRLVGEKASPDSSTEENASFFLRDLPELRTHALVWEGEPSGPVEGDAFALVAVPEIFDVEMVLTLNGTWIADPPERPPGMSMDDWATFAEPE